MMVALREHCPEYLCEAAELGLFMISAGLFTILLHNPSSPVLNFIPSEFTRRMLTGIAMGSTAIALVFSPLGKRSGAHFNPAVTLTFWRLGKVKNWDALFYVVAQFIGVIAGALVATYITLESPLSGMSMNPARTFGSAFVGHIWVGLWIYFTAPVLAMQFAATVYLRGKGTVYCAKYHHYNRHRCIFNCRFPELLERERATEPVTGGVDAGGMKPQKSIPAGSKPPATTTASAQ